MGGPHTFATISPTNSRNKLRFNSSYPSMKIVPIAIMLLPNFSNWNITTQVNTLSVLWLHKNPITMVLLRNKNISKALVFFSRQRNPSASGLFSRVKVVLLLSLHKTPVTPVSIPSHKKKNNSNNVVLTSQNLHCHCCFHDKLLKNHFLL